MIRRPSRSPQSTRRLAKANRNNTHAPGASGDTPFLLVARYATIVAILASSFVLDPFADASFDAPKWLLVKLAAITAIVSLLLAPPSPPKAAWAPAARWSFGLLVGAVGCAVLATLFSIHGEASWRALFAMIVCGLYLVIGASRVLHRAAGQRIFVLFIITSVCTALVSLMQAAGIPLPLNVQHVGGRFPNGALLGNEGFVALLCALLGASGLGLLFGQGTTKRTRTIAIAITSVAVVTIIVNRQVTSAVALGIAATTVIALRFGRRWLVVALATTILLLGACAAIPVLRAHTWAALPGASVDAYQRLTTYRLGGWIAADEIVRANPWLGRGPGSFARESTARRLDAEIRVGARFVQPTGGTFVYAHMDLLQLAAECGAPAAILVALALGITFRNVAIFAHAAHRAETLVLLGVVTAGSVSSLAWFPLQIPVTAVALLLACGRLWRICADTDPEAR